MNDTSKTEYTTALTALFHRQLALDSLSPAARALEEKDIIKEFERLRSAKPAASAPSAAPAARALRFAYEIVADELRMGHPGHDNVMVALEVVLRPERASVVNVPPPPYAAGGNTLAALLADAHTRLMCAGYSDDASLAGVKAARDWARGLAVRPQATEPARALSSAHATV